MISLESARSSQRCHHQTPCARRWAGHETPTLFYLAVFGSIVSYIYSAPPLKLKQSGWIGNYALGSSYIALPWLAGQVRFANTSSLACAATIIVS